MSEKTYAQLFEQVKVWSDAKKSGLEVKATAQGLVNELVKELKGVILDNAQLVQELVLAKFKEGGLTNVGTAISPIDELTADNVVASGLIGDYPDNAFNIQVEFNSGLPVVHVWRVPKGGNLR